MRNAQYKGFAYTKEGNKPTAVYGVSQNDILAKLRSYNVARTQKDKFVSCNIGSLNEETSKYENYHRYEVATDKDITAVYLNIPPLNRDEFRKVTADLKAAGAKFNPKKKAWYITDGQAGQELQTYLDSLGTNAKANETAGIRIPEEKTVLPDSLLDSVRRSVELELEKPDFMIEGLEVQYAVKMQNQQTVIIPESTLNKMWSQEGIRGSYNEFFDELNEKALEQLQAEDIPDPERIADESDYVISVDKQQHENKCTVWFNDGREPIEINGYEHGVIFPEMDAGAAADFVGKYLKNIEQPDRYVQPEYHEGDIIDCYVPLRLQNIDPSQPIYIENVSHIAGHIRGIETLVDADAKTYEILQEDGNVMTIRSDEIYAPDQARVLLRAAADELTGVQFDLLADRNLSAAQMEEIRFGLKDGLTAEQVAFYANPNMTPAEMDLCRIGLNNRLDYVEISRLLKETKELSWTDSRNRLNEAIKDHRVIEEARKAAHEAGLPFSENMTSEVMDPYVYDGSMSVEDHMQMLNRMEESASEPSKEELAEEGEKMSEIQSRIVEHVHENFLPGAVTIEALENDRVRITDRQGEHLDMAMNQNGDIVDANTNKIYEYAKPEKVGRPEVETAGAKLKEQTADFYGTKVPVVDGKRVISQTEINQLHEHLLDRSMSVEKIDFTDCFIQNVDFNVFNIYENPLPGADFSGSKFYNCKFGNPGRILDLRECCFRDASFYDTSFRNTILKQCDFQKASLSNCQFRSSDVIDVNFSEASLKRTIFMDCPMENNSFWKTGMDGVDVYESCSIMDQKHIDTISYTMGGATREEVETMKERTLWRLSGQEVSYDRMKELQKLFQNEKAGSLDSENENWRLDLSRDEEELVDQWDKQQTVTRENQQVLSKVDVTYISEDVMKLGYKPTEKLISNIQKLDAITGERHGLKDVRDLYLQNEFQSPELKQTVLEIAEECKQQELARMAAPVNMPG